LKLSLVKHLSTRWRLQPIYKQMQKASWKIIIIICFKQLVFKSTSGKAIYKQITNTINDKHPIQ